MDNFLYQLLNQTLTSPDQSIQEKSISVLGNFICTINSDFLKTLQWDINTNTLETELFCVQCHLNSLKDNEARKEFLKSEYGHDDAVVNFRKVSMKKMTNYPFLKYVLAQLSSDCVALKIAALPQLISLSTHVEQFHSKNVTAIWVQLIGDPDEKVRKELTEVIECVLTNLQVSVFFCLNVCKSLRDSS